MTYLEHLAISQLNRRIAMDKTLVMMIDNAMLNGRVFDDEHMTKYDEAKRRIEADTQTIAKIMEADQ